MLRVPFTLLLPTLLVLGACESTPRTPYGFDPLPARGLFDRQPADIAVLTVENRSGMTAVPTEALRQALYIGLVDRLYSPLALDYVDRKWTEASVPASGASEIAIDAVLQVVVTRWDVTTLQSRGSILASGEALLFPGGGLAGTPLWGVRFDTRLAGLSPEELEGDPYEVGAGQLAAEILAQLPVRDPLAAER
ncbi:MAG: hypothetical protein O7B99_10880 [Planctomycetota bacterium]|nr:hypothetical protein [Planctomycetota bacterium]